MKIAKSQDVIGAEVTGIDLARLSDDAFGAIDQAFCDHSVLCFRDQELDEEQLIAFARRLGGIEENWLTHYTHPRHPEILYVSNIKKDGRDIGHADAGSVWHTDQSFTPKPPRATMLYALEVPMENGVALGNTLFASAADAHDSLPEATQRRISGLRVIHNLAGRRARTGTGAQTDQALRREKPDVVHPLVRTHPWTGRKCLYVNKGECVGIEGMATDEALTLIEELADRIVEPRFQHTHRWRVHDLLLWDNCALQHLASFDYKWPRHRRLLQRVMVEGSIPV